MRVDLRLQRRSFRSVTSNPQACAFRCSVLAVPAGETVDQRAEVFLRAQTSDRQQQRIRIATIRIAIIRIVTNRIFARLERCRVGADAEV